MPTTNLYNIVTNDKYELPYLCDIKGKQAAADFLGIGLTQFYRNIKSDKWKGKYKAVFIGECPCDEYFKPNENILPFTSEERKIRSRIKKETLDKNRVIKHRLDSKEYYRMHREQIIEYGKEYYRKRRKKNECSETV